MSEIRTTTQCRALEQALSKFLFVDNGTAVKNELHVNRNDSVRNMFLRINHFVALLENLRENSSKIILCRGHKIYLITKIGILEQIFRITVVFMTDSFINLPKVYDLH